MPGWTWAKRNVPVSVVVVVIVWSVSSFVSVTVTPGRTATLLSNTDPASRPNEACAATTENDRSTSNTTMNVFFTGYFPRRQTIKRGSSRRWIRLSKPGGR